MTIRFYLGEEKVYRNKNEYHTKPTRRYLNIEVSSYGGPISKLAELLAAKNPDFNPDVEIYRGDTLVFHAAPLKSWIKSQPFRKEVPRGLVK